MKVTVEVVCCSVEDHDVAIRAGAERIELCSAIELGGLTPSAGLQRACAEMDGRLPLISMLRPRAGNFCYSEAELAVMIADKSSLDDSNGYALGILDGANCIDAEGCKLVLKELGSSWSIKCDVVFHRAFDSVSDQFRALDVLIDLGFTRVMTSGRQRTAAEGIDTIKRLVDHAAGRIEIMPAGGIRASNVKSVISAGCQSIHLGPFKEIDSSDQWGCRRRLDEPEVQAVVQIVNDQVTSS
jgi:copper homeostasis protein